MNVTDRSFRRITLLPLLLLASLAPPLSGQTAGLSSFEGIQVSTGDRNDTSRLTDGGVVSVDGSSAFVITIAGELRGRADHDGVIGVLLVPELPFFTSAYRTRGRVLSAAEFTAPVAAGASSYFMSPSKRAETGFGSYRLLLYNTTGAPASVNVYVYPIRSSR